MPMLLRHIGSEVIESTNALRDSISKTASASYGDVLEHTLVND
jgi:hypothetical protein